MPLAEPGPGFTRLPYAAVEWDGVPAASVTHSNEVEEDGCCGRNHEYVILREGGFKLR